MTINELIQIVPHDKWDEELVLSYDLGEKENGDPLDITSAVVAQDCIILESK